MWEKQPLIFLNISQNLQKIKKNKNSEQFWTFKSKLRIIHAATYIHCFFLTLINVFLLVPYIHICLYYFLILCSYFHLLFLTLLAARHILQFTMLDSISLQPAREIIKTLYRPWQRKNCRVNLNQSKCSNMIIYGTKYEFFLPLYQITFFLAFGQANIFFSYYILMNILINIILWQKNL